MMKIPTAPIVSAMTMMTMPYAISLRAAAATALKTCSTRLQREAVRREADQDDRDHRQRQRRVQLIAAREQAAQDRRGVRERRRAERHPTRARRGGTSRHGAASAGRRAPAMRRPSSASRTIARVRREPARGTRPTRRTFTRRRASPPSSMVRNRLTYVPHPSMPGCRRGLTADSRAAIRQRDVPLPPELAPFSSARYG